MSAVWFISGLLVGALAYWFVTFAHRRLTAAQWVVWAVWAAWVIFTIAFVVTSLGEGSPRAAGVGALIFGGIAAVVTVPLRKWSFSVTRKPQKSA